MTSAPNPEMEATEHASTIHGTLGTKQLQRMASQWGTAVMMSFLPGESLAKEGKKRYSSPGIREFLQPGQL